MRSSLWWTMRNLLCERLLVTLPTNAEDLSDSAVPVLLCRELTHDVGEGIALCMYFGGIHLRRVPRSDKIKALLVNQECVPKKAARDRSTISID
jgi:hypothetical protein